jgi:hypothetical protein
MCYTGDETTVHLGMYCIMIWYCLPVWYDTAGAQAHWAQEWAQAPTVQLRTDEAFTCQLQRQWSPTGVQLAGCG